MKFSLLCVLVATVAASAGKARPLPAQNAVRVNVQGVAWDSLHNAPLSGAFIVLKGGQSYSTTSDSGGRFHIDSISPGKYASSVQHDILDSIGLHGLAVPVTVTLGTDTLHLALPSFATLWRAACGARSPPADSGFVYGTVRDAKLRQAMPGAEVGAIWLDLSFDKKTGVSQTRMGGVVKSDAGGTYAICGIPDGIVIQLRATSRSASTPYVDVTMGPLRIHRRDLMLGTFDSSGAARFGIVVGELQGASGQAVVDARITSDGLPETRSDTRGRFVIRDVPVGSRQLEVTAIGSLPVATSVDVVENDTAKVMLSLTKVTALEEVRITALSVRERRKADFEEHRKLGIGRFLDSTVIEKRVTIVGALAEAPQLKVKNGAILFITGHNRDCVPIFWIDNQIVTQEDVKFLSLKTIAAIEIYPRKFMIPSEFWGARGMPGCAIVVWTKMYFP